MDQRVLIRREDMPEMEHVMLSLAGMSPAQQNYVLGVIDGTAAEHARQQMRSAFQMARPVV